VWPSVTQHDLARREPTSSPTLVRLRPRANIKGHSEPWSRVSDSLRADNKNSPMQSVHAKSPTHSSVSFVIYRDLQSVHRLLWQSSCCVQSIAMGSTRCTVWTLHVSRMRILPFFHHFCALTTCRCNAPEYKTGAQLLLRWPRNAALLFFNALIVSQSVSLRISPSIINCRN